MGGGALIAPRPLQPCKSTSSKNNCVSETCSWRASSPIPKGLGGDILGMRVQVPVIKEALGTAFVELTLDR